MLRRMPVRGIVLLTMFVAACAPAAPGPARDGQQAPPERPRGTKTLTFGINFGVEAMGVVGATTTSGGWQSLNELHSNGLITADTSSRRPVGHLAEKAPSFDDGSIALQPDGRMRVVYRLRSGITWQDGTPLTADDLVFTHSVHSDPAISQFQHSAIREIESVQALDDRTVAITFRGAHYQGPTLGLRLFWPQPRHLLGEAFRQYRETGNPETVTNLRYWSSEYVHLGPFRLTSLDPVEGLAFEAYDGYFMGRPKVDIVRVRIFADQNTLFANLLANSVDAFTDSALAGSLGFQLKERWERAGEGTVHVSQGNTRFMVPQFRPAYQSEPANLDPRVRAALLHALDREALLLALQDGHTELAAWSILPPGDRFYDATRDGFRRYAYDPGRARDILRQAGWAPGGDGVLRHSSDGRRFRNAILATPGGEQEIAAYASFWRQIGIDVDEVILTAAQTRNRELRAVFPSWTATASGTGDVILNILTGPAATAETSFQFGSRVGYEDPTAQELFRRYQTSLTERDQSQAMKAIGDFVVEQLPLLLTFYEPQHVGGRKGVRAFEDAAGGAEAGQPYGTYSRNAYLWEVVG